MTDELFSHCAPVLSVDDVMEAANFYKHKLGFDITFTYGEPTYYAVVKRGEGVSIHLSEREDTSTPIARCHVYIFVSDVDALYEEYLSKGVKIHTPPATQEHGMRDFDLNDSSGHFLTFGTGV